MSQRMHRLLGLLLLGLLAVAGYRVDAASDDRSEAALERADFTIQLLTADPVQGIAGYVKDRGDIRIRFESRVLDGVLNSKITDAAGEALAVFVEDGVAIPSLIISGRRFLIGDPEMREIIEKLAARPESVLIRALAYELVYTVPGKDLARARRGLEVPFQAIQTHVPKPAELPAYAKTDDYVSLEGRYMVKGLDTRLILVENWVPQDQRHKYQQNQAALLPGTDPLLHDENRVGSCFGRCGGGCGSWQDRWLGTPSVRTEPIDDQCARIIYTGSLEHRTCGCRTHGCAAHDWCVRTFCPDNPACAFCWPEAIWAGITAISCLWIRDTCWTYVDDNWQTSAVSCGGGDGTPDPPLLKR